MKSKGKRFRFEIGEQAIARGRYDRRLVEIIKITRTAEGEILITGRFPSYPEVSEGVSRSLRANGLEVDDEIGLVRGPQEKFGKLAPVILRGLVLLRILNIWENVKDKFRKE